MRCIVYAPPVETSKTSSILVAEAALAVNELQDLSDVTADIMKAAVDAGIIFKIRIELGIKAVPSAEAVEQINKLLQDVSKHLKLV